MPPLHRPLLPLTFPSTSPLSLPQETVLRNSLLTFIVVDRGESWGPGGRQCSSYLPPIRTTVSSCNEGGVMWCVGVQVGGERCGRCGRGGRQCVEGSRKTSSSVGECTTTHTHTLTPATIHAHAALTRTPLTWLHAAALRRITTQTPPLS